jgi:hypothetical protein
MIHRILHLHLCCAALRCAFGLCRAPPQAEPLTICFHSGPLWARPPAVMSYLHCTRVAPTFDWGSGMSSCFKGLLSPWSQCHVLGTSTSTSHLQLAGFSPLSWAVSGRPSRPNHRKMLQLVCDGHDLQHLWHPAALQTTNHCQDASGYLTASLYDNGHWIMWPFPYRFSLTCRNPIKTDSTVTVDLFTSNPV